MGTKPGILKRHLLFYSVVDQQYFIAIQDQYTGTVVTVLTLDYHRNLAWNISEKDKKLAKAKVSLLECRIKVSLNANKKLFVSVVYIDIDIEGVRKVKLILKEPAIAFGLDVKKIMMNPDLIIILKSNLYDISLKQVLGFSIKFGKSSTPEYFTKEECKL